jgi:hypothetical protein
MRPASVVGQGVNPQHAIHAGLTFQRLAERLP